MIYHLLSGGTSDNFYINSFQKYKQELAIKLKRILDSGPKEDFKVAIPYSILSTKDYIGVERVFWERFVILDIKRFQTLLKKDYLYLNSCFTRFYLNHRRSDFQQYVNLLKTIWAGKELCIIEGKNSRLGVGNDLFENAASIVRILCPTTDAFDKYNEILSEALRQPKEKLFLIALGHTATVLAYELYSHGYWAIDIGHVDIEYEWFLRHATKKVSVSGKYINEIPEGRVFDECDDQEYLNQIVVAIDN